MSKSRHPPELMRCDRWPGVNEEQLDVKTRQRFNTYKAALEAICAGERQSHVAMRYALTNSNLSYLLDRCVARHPDGRPWGYRALVYNTRQREYKRTKPPVVAPGSDGYGLAGAFELMLERHPKVTALIQKAIRGVGKLGVKEGGLNLAGVHAEILVQLKADGVGHGEYPFNTRSAGYFSLTRYIRRLVDEGDNTAARHRYGKPALEGLQAGTGERGVLQALHPLDVACYDEQQMPFIGTLVYEIEGKELHVALARGYICVLIDTHSRCVLGYAVTVAERFRSLHLLKSYEGFLTPWQPMNLTVPNLKYQPGAGLPSGVIPECRGRLVCMISVDNHLTHLAESVVGHLRVQTGVILRYGRVRQWIARQVVEGLFAAMQEHSFRRLPSTTGSGPGDASVSQPVQKAVDFRIRMDQLLEVVDVVIANYNATPRRDLMNKTPLEALATGVDERSRLSIIPRMPQAKAEGPKLAVEIITSTVRGSRAKGRRPYIEIDCAKYTNDILAQSWALIGKRLTVHISGDFRKVRVFREDGTEFGVLMVMGHWAQSFHTRESRKEINKLHREGVINKWVDDPVKVFEGHLIKESLKKAAANPYKISSESNKLAAILHKQSTGTIQQTLSAQSLEGQKTASSLKSRGRGKFFNSDGRKE